MAVPSSICLISSVLFGSNGGNDSLEPMVDISLISSSVILDTAVRLRNTDLSLTLPDVESFVVVVGFCVSFGGSMSFLYVFLTFNNIPFVICVFTVCVVMLLVVRL